MGNQAVGKYFLTWVNFASSLIAHNQGHLPLLSLYNCCPEQSRGSQRRVVTERCVQGRPDSGPSVLGLSSHHRLGGQLSQ